MPADDQNIILLAKCAGATGPREHGPHTLVVVAGIALMPSGPQASRLGSARRMGVSAWGQETAGLREEKEPLPCAAAKEVIGRIGLVISI